MQRKVSLGALRRPAFWGCLVALAIALPAIAEDSADSKGSPEAAAAKGAGDAPNPKAADNRAKMRARMIEEFDTDGDGKLSKEERQAAREKRQAERIKKFDTDGDGKLSQEEITAARTQMKAHRRNAADANGDGNVSKEERQAARARNAHWTTKELEQFDANGDGNLSPEEAEKARAARQEQRKQMGVGPNRRSQSADPDPAPPGS